MSATDIDGLTQILNFEKIWGLKRVVSLAIQLNLKDNHLYCYDLMNPKRVLCEYPLPF